MDKNEKLLIRPYLRTRSLVPENQESPIEFMNTPSTPEDYFYKRNHFPYPEIQKNAFELSIEGEVHRPMVFSLQDLLSLPSKEIAMVMECAGNKRAFFEPKVFGEQWEMGAMSQGVWKGVPLAELLKYTGVTFRVREVVFEGHDYGYRIDLNGEYRFARSLPIDKAIHPDTIIAYEYNGKPIPFKHGYPIRLIVPQWYGMASVKWLRKITLIANTFNGPFQAIDYMYYPKDNDIGKTPVTRINVNSTILQPHDLAQLDTGIHTVFGIAWTGMGTISEVEISLDQGGTWEKTQLYQDLNSMYGWTYWSYKWYAEKKGEYVLMARAKDTYGRMQPSNAFWNRKGYGFNAISSVRVKIE
jgi:sulfite oxidase